MNDTFENHYFSHGKFTEAEKSSARASNDYSSQLAGWNAHGEHNSEPQSQWKPGQMLISKCTGRVYRLGHQHGDDLFEHEYFESGKWVAGSWSNFIASGYEPYPRVGDLVRCKCHHSPWCVMNVRDYNTKIICETHLDIEPASQPVEQQTEQPTLEGPHWDRLRTRENSDLDINKCLFDLRDTVKDLILRSQKIA